MLRFHQAQQLISCIAAAGSSTSSRLIGDSASVTHEQQRRQHASRADKAVTPIWPAASALVRSQPRERCRLNLTPTCVPDQHVPSVVTADDVLLVSWSHAGRNPTELYKYRSDTCVQSCRSSSVTNSSAVSLATGPHPRLPAAAERLAVPGRGLQEAAGCSARTLLAQAARAGRVRGKGAGVVLGPAVAPAAPLPRIHYALEAADEFPRVVPKDTSHGPARQGSARCRTERARCVENAPIGSGVSPISCSCVYRDTSAVASQGADLQSARNLQYRTP